MDFRQRALYLHQHIPGPWLVALILVICFFAFSLRQKEEISAHQYDSSGFPQTYMTSVETREFGPQGKLRYQLSTPLITHFQVEPNAPSERDYTLIDHPKMAFYDTEATTPWRVTADTGRSETNGQLIRLLGNVVIQQHTPTRGLVTITTSELRIRAEQQFAETDKAVNMRSAKGQMNAVGMEADLAQSRLQLKSQVKAVYEPR